MKEAVRDLGQTLEEAASETGVVSGLIDSIGKALAEVRCSSVNSLRTCYKCKVIGWVGKKLPVFALRIFVLSGQIHLAQYILTVIIFNSRKPFWNNYFVRLINPWLTVEQMDLKVSMNHLSIIKRR